MCKLMISYPLSPCGGGHGRRGVCSEKMVMCRSYLALATGQGNVDETASVDETLAGTALGGLLLLLLLNLGGCALDLTGTSELWVFAS